MRTKLGERSTCRHCGQDIEFHGTRLWVDRGNGRKCLPYENRKLNQIVRPKTNHRPLEN